MLKPLEISQARVRELFDCREGRLYWRHREDVVGRGWNARWVGKEAGATPKYSGYHNVKIDGVFYRRCRLVWIWHNGEIAVGEYVDHVNCNRGDDSIENLRIGTSSQNSYNRSSYRESKFLRGVYRPSGKGSFRARITADRKIIELGAFPSEQEAHAAYLSAANRLHGDFRSRCASSGASH